MNLLEIGLKTNIRTHFRHFGEVTGSRLNTKFIIPTSNTEVEDTKTKSKPKSQITLQMIFLNLC